MLIFCELNLIRHIVILSCICGFKAVDSARYCVNIYFTI